MKTYTVYYTCPFCRNPCCEDPDGEANEMVEADSKAEARQFFNNAKQCRWMKVSRIEEYNPGFRFLSAEINGKPIPAKSVREAFDMMAEVLTTA